MNFLALCTRLAEESGTGNAPTSVVGATGRAKKLVNWVRSAWLKIQNSNPYWFFLRAEFEKTVTAGVATYAGDAAPWSLARFAEFDPGPPAFTLYDPGIGRTDEGYLHQITYDAWRSRWDFGTHDQNRPTEYAIAPDGSIRFGAAPDETYMVRGRYLKTPQELAADADVPDMPARFHDIIIHRALILMAEHDEGVFELQTAQSEYKEMLAQMQRDLLPTFNMRSQGPIA